MKPFARLMVDISHLPLHFEDGNCWSEWLGFFLGGGALENFLVAQEPHMFMLRCYSSQDAGSWRNWRVLPWDSLNKIFKKNIRILVVTNLRVSHLNEMHPELFCLDRRWFFDVFFLIVPDRFWLFQFFSSFKSFIVLSFVCIIAQVSV